MPWFTVASASLGVWGGHVCFCLRGTILTVRSLIGGGRECTVAPVLLVAVVDVTELVVVVNELACFLAATSNEHVVLLLQDNVVDRGFNLHLDGVRGTLLLVKRH
jgi:hypothetical protein